MSELAPNLPKMLIATIHPDAVIPSQATEHDAGYDLHCVGQYVIGPGQRSMLHTGIAIAIPPGHVGYIKPRSGLALHHGIDVLGGVIDSGYRGEVGVILINTGTAPVKFLQGDRVAQLVIQPVTQVQLQEVELLPGSQRGAGGFGSTGA